ncbi:hypothetical protein WDW86_21580 [Bdellovibrionota bacterium FG-2]
MFFIIALWISFASLSSSSAGAATPASSIARDELSPISDETNLPALRATSTWLNETGQRSALAWKKKTLWAWGNSTDPQPIKHLLLRTWIFLPPGHSLKGIEASFMRRALDPGTPPVLETNEVPVALDMDAPGDTAKLRVTDPSGRESVVQLSVELIKSTAVAVTHPSCRESGLGLSAKRGRGNVAFSSAVCVDRGNAVDLYFFYSRDGVLKKTGISGLRNTLPGMIEIRLAKPKQVWSGPRWIGGFQIAEKQSDTPAEYLVYFAPKFARTASGVTPEIAFTRLTYTEDPGNIRLTETALTGKLSGELNLIPSVLDVDAAVFMTLLPISLSSTDFDPARFYGLNARLGYHLPLGMGATEWRFLLGAYFWGMSVPGDAYGIQSLWGPQMFISTRHQQVGSRNWSFYVKYVPISSGFSLANRELAGGLTYQFNSPEARTAWSLVLDVSDFRFKAADDSAQVGLFSTSLGIQVGL